MHTTPVAGDEELSEEWKEIAFDKIQEITMASKFLLPSDNSYYCSSIPGFRSKINKLSGTVTSILRDVIMTSGLLLKSRGETDDMDVEIFDDLLENYESIVDLTDSLLEKAARNRDFAMKSSDKGTQLFSKDPVITSLIPTLAPHGNSIINHNNALKSNNNTRDVITQFNIIHSENVQRPQLKFKEKVDNTNTPFVVKLKEKPNALRPINTSIMSESSQQTSHNGDQNNKPTPFPNFKYNNINIMKDLENHMINVSDVNSYCGNKQSNPYYYEIMNLVYPQHQLTPSAEIMYLQIEETPLIWVDTTEALNSLIDDLSSSIIFAIDIESHSYRSYLGFVCLIQISTRKTDYIIDALALRSELQILNKVFTDSKILKIMHGSDSDIKWLQRDFGVYVVNMFDTCQSARILGLPHFSLDYLLKRYCNVTSNKSYQLADWRIRPLIPKMVEYARIDSHYLLYIYDRMKNELIEASKGETTKLGIAFERSALICCNVFIKEMYDRAEGKGSCGWKNALKKIKPPLNSEQTEIFKALHSWRDVIARQEDESPGFVIPFSVLTSLSRNMPNDVKSLLKACRTTTPMLKQYSADIVRLINDSRTNYAKLIHKSTNALDNKLCTIEFSNSYTDPISTTENPPSIANNYADVHCVPLNGECGLSDTSSNDAPSDSFVCSTNISEFFPTSSSPSTYHSNSLDIVNIKNALYRKFFFLDNPPPPQPVDTSTPPATKNSSRLIDYQESPSTHKNKRLLSNRKKNNNSKMHVKQKRHKKSETNKFV